MDKLIICIKWGKMYGPEYVNIMPPCCPEIYRTFRLVCFTDETNGVKPHIECLPLPRLDVDVPSDAPGKWPKQALWAKNLQGLDGVALFLDLDSVIVDRIDPYFEFGEENDDITARNWVKPLSRMAQTSVFRFKIGSHSYLLDNLRKDPTLMSKYRYEQNYVSSCVRGGVKFWPYSWTKHFGVHCMGPWPLRYLRTPKFPKASRIITFPGRPKPPDAIRGEWYPGQGNASPFKRLVWVLKSKILKLQNTPRFKTYVRPTRWVKEHWSE